MDLWCDAEQRHPFHFVHLGLHPLYRTVGTHAPHGRYSGDRPFNGGGHGGQAVRWTAHSLRGGGIHCCIFPRSEALETVRGPVSGFFGGKCAAGGGLAVVSFASV